MIPTNVLQSMMALNASEIDAEQIFQQSYKDLRTYYSKQGNQTLAERYNKMVDKSRAKMKILVRNQKALKDELQENHYREYIFRATDLWE